MSCLYASLALGPISIVSPLSAVISAIVPAAFGLYLGDTFSPWGYLAIVLLLIAVVLVGFVPGADVRMPTPQALLLGAAAGAGIGAVLICLDQAPEESGLTPVIMLRAVSASLLGLFLIAVLVRERGKVRASESKTGMHRFWFAVAAAGLFDSSANVFFLLASRTGSLTVVSVLTALYPLGTIILARVILKEKIARTQQVGIGLALAASAILAIT
jgi:drug/metabolite transporter (DMT)-like permease